jgi:hypothetical protein
MRSPPGSYLDLSLAFREGAPIVEGAGRTVRGDRAQRHGYDSADQVAAGRPHVDPVQNHGSLIWIAVSSQSV